MIAFAPPITPSDSIQAETLDLLEWPRLCQHLATFAATKLGAAAAQRLPIPATRDRTLALLAQTCDAYLLETQLDRGLPLGGVTDIGESLERAERQGVLSGEALLDLASTLAAMRQVRRVIDATEGLTVLPDLVAELRTYPELEQDIHHCIEDNGRVSDRASPKLAGIREQQRHIRDGIYQKLQRIMQQQARAIQESTVVQRGDRFVIPVKAPQKDAISGIVHDSSASGATLYVEPYAIVEPNNRLRLLTRQEEAESEAVRRRLTEQVAEVREDLERLLAIATTLDLATARARYSLWLEANPPRFVQDETMILRGLRHPLLVWQQRHEQGGEVVPVDVAIAPTIRVVAITGPNTGGKTVTLKTLGLAALMAKVGLFIPAREPVEMPWFDQVLADIGDEQSLEQSLSTFSGHIRRIARILAALPAIATPDSQNSGSPTANAQNPNAQNPNAQDLDAQDPNAQDPNTQDPNAQDLDAHNLDNLDPDIQDPDIQDPDIQDSNSQELEPFGVDRQDSAAMRAAIARLDPIAARPALVLLDEVGAGTDPAEGSALATALLRTLADRARLAIATTHYGELKALKYQDSRFENASVEFDDRTLSPTYRLLWGIPGRSNALAIARRLGLDAAVVDAAVTQMGSGSEDVNRTIAGLEAQRRAQEARANEVAHLLERAQYLHDQIDRKAQSLKEREAALRKSQERAVQAAIAEARQEIAQVIRDLKRAGSPTGHDTQRATAQVQAIATQHLPSQQPRRVPQGYKPSVGEKVRVPRLGSTAEVLAIDEADGDLTVRIGLMKATIPLTDIESLDGKTVTIAKPDPKPDPKPEPRRSPPPAPPQERPTVRTEVNTLDLRGARVADAERDIEQGIDRAIAADRGALWIIHGKGTGKLRQGVRAYLDHHSLVLRYEDGDRTSGGTGVTVAYLR
jgi:DNA mismatch repair protein MutS2